MSNYKLSLIEIENLGPIGKLRVDWQLGDILVFKGKNGTGKTTATSHLSQLLQNQSMPQPLKKGTQAGYFKAILKDGDGKNTEILHKFDEQGQTLTVIAPNGHEMGVSAGKTFLSKLAQDKRSFYIPDYLEITAPQKRMEMILRLIPIELANVIATDSKKLKECRDNRQKAFQEVTLQKGKAVVFDEALALKEPVSPVTLANQKQAISDHNARYERSAVALPELQKTADQSKEIAKIEEEIGVVAYDLGATLKRLKETYEAEVARVTAESEAATKRLNAKMGATVEIGKEGAERLKRANDWLSDPENQPKPATEIEAIDKQLSNLNEENQKIADAKRVRAEHAKLKELELAWDSRDSECKEAETALRVKMTEAKLPAGLSIEIDDDAVLSLNLGNVPLEQSSSSERTIAQLHLSLASMGELGFVRFDGTLVDDSNMEAVMAWLKEHDYQAAIEIMERSGGGTVTYEVADKYFALPEYASEDEYAGESPATKTLFDAMGKIGSQFPE